MRKRDVFLMVVMVVIIGLLPVNSYAGGSEEQSVKVRVTSKLSDRFDLNTTPIERINTVYVSEGEVEVGVGFETFIEVIDVRGDHDGWYLTVQAKPLQKGGSQLPEGNVSLKPVQELRNVTKNNTQPSIELKREEVIDQGPILVAKAEEGEGRGIYELDFGEKPLQFYIDAEQVETGVYETVIEWGLETKRGEKKIIKKEEIEIEIEKDEGKENTVDEERKEEGEGIKDSKVNEEEVTKEEDTKEEEDIKEEGEGKKGLTVPDTATNLFNIILIGVVVVLVGFLLYRREINKKDKKENKNIK